jgi:hypothetical protein
MQPDLDDILSDGGTEDLQRLLEELSGGLSDVLDSLENNLSDLLDRLSKP